MTKSMNGNLSIGERIAKKLNVTHPEKYGPFSYRVDLYYHRIKNLKQWEIQIITLGFFASFYIVFFRLAAIVDHGFDSITLLCFDVFFFGIGLYAWIKIGSLFRWSGIIDAIKYNHEAIPEILMDVNTKSHYATDEDIQREFEETKKELERQGRIIKQRDQEIAEGIKALANIVPDDVEAIMTAKEENINRVKDEERQKAEQQREALLATLRSIRSTENQSND